MTDAVLIYSTAPSREVADALAASLLDKRLAACVNMIDGMRTRYRWQGRIEESVEVVLLIKTAHGQVDAIQRLLAEEHPYEVPACLVFTADGGLDSFLAWIAQETGAPVS